MQLAALVPLLALLASPALAETSHPNAAAKFAHRRADAHRAAVRHVKEQDQHHGRAVDTVKQNIGRREALAQLYPPAKERRVRKRGAACNASNSTSSTSTSTSTASTTTTDSATSSSTTTWSSTWSSSAGTDNQDWATPASSATPAASTGSSNNNSGGGGGGGNTQGTINGFKAGLSGGTALSPATGHIGWWYDWNAIASSDTPSGVDYIPQLWGNGQSGAPDDWQRFQDFQTISPPAYVLGFYEPDCSPPMSSNIDPQTAASVWNQYIVPLRQNHGTVLLSPGVCKQKDETWLPPFLAAIGDDNQPDWIVAHINKPDMQGVMDDLNHFATYGKPIFVSEFACVWDQNNFTPCSDQGQINQLINDAVSQFQSDTRVIGYALTDGEGLNDMVTMTFNGAVTQAGQTFINVISNL